MRWASRTPLHVVSMTDSRFPPGSATPKGRAAAEFDRAAAPIMLEAGITISHVLLHRFGLRFVQAMSNQFAARQTLRHAVDDVLDEIRAQGIRGDTAGSIVKRLLSAHPKRHRLDRVSVLDRSRSFDHLMEEVQRWLDERAR